MLRSAQPSQFSTYPSQYIDTPGLAVLKLVNVTDKGTWHQTCQQGPSNNIPKLKP